MALWVEAFLVCSVSSWHRLPGEVVGPTSLEVFQHSGDVRDMVSGHGGGGLGWALVVLSNLNDSVILEALL